MKTKGLFISFFIITCLYLFLLPGCSPADPHINSSYNYLTKNEPDMALMEANRAIEADPSNALGYNNKSAALIILRRYFDALHAADNAISLDPGMKLAHLNRGRALYFLGRYKEAIAELNSAALGLIGNSAAMQMATQFKSMSITELDVESILESTESERIEQAVNGEPVFYVIKKPLSARFHNWQFGLMLYVDNITASKFLSIDETPFMRIMGAIDYRRVPTDYGYDYSFQMITPSGNISTTGKRYIDYVNFTVEENTRITGFGMTVEGREIRKVEEYGTGVLVKFNSTMPSSIVSSISQINKLHCDMAKSYIVWIGNIDSVDSESNFSKQPDVETKMKTGTGFAVSPDGHIVTAFHVIKDGSNIKVKFGHDDWIPAKVVQKSYSNDVAILKIDQNIKHFFKFAEEVRQGQKVFTIGYPVPGLLGEEPKYSDGTISSLSGIADEASWVQVSVSLQPGNSGGPLIDEKGCVVGMVTAAAEVESFLHRTGTLPQNINWAIKYDFILPLIPQEYRQIDDNNMQSSDVVAEAKKAICFVQVQEAMDN